MLGEYQREEALIHLRRGIVLERANRVEEAVVEYRRAVAHNPNLAEAHGALASYYRRHGLLAKAADALRTVAILSDTLTAHSTLGGVLLELGRIEEALASFERCLRLAPDFAPAHYALASARLRSGDYQAALGHLRRALPHYQDAWELHHLEGSCHLHLGRYDEAQAAFEQALVLAPAARPVVEERLAALGRYRALGRLGTLKDRLYAEAAVALLGSAQDDGVGLQAGADYYFTYPDIATTLRRLCALAADWPLGAEAVVPADRLAEPIAAALARALDLPLRPPSALARGERAVVVLAAGPQPELLALVAQRSGGAALTFCLGLARLWHGELPDISGVVVRGACGVPWEAELHRLRALGAPPREVEACLGRAAAEIIRALSELPAETNLASQREYYRLHDQLRFLKRTSKV
jgi:tetratricopeptide (TPR) repeat protein